MHFGNLFSVITVIIEGVMSVVAGLRQSRDQVSLPSARFASTRNGEGESGMASW